MNEDECAHRRGIPAARSNLDVARLAASKYLTEAAGHAPDKHNLMLYYGAFFFFARSALYALEGSDSRLSPDLKPLQKAYFASTIANDPVFVMLKQERDRIGHGDDSWGRHPMLPLRMIERFISAGHEWDVAVFDNVWPDPPFNGASMEVVMNTVYRTVSKWLDAIDALDQVNFASKQSAQEDN